MCDKQLSKTLSWILRHGATKLGLKIGNDGYVDVGSLLEIQSLRGKCTIHDIKNIVVLNDKQRFTLRENPTTKRLEIRANQGHSLKVS